VADNAQLEKAALNAQMLRQLKPGFEQAGVGTSNAMKAGRQGFRLTTVPQLDGMYLDPHLAVVFDRMYNKAAPMGVPARLFQGLNHLANRALFLNPIGHPRNVFWDTVVSRGWQNLNPVSTWKFYKQELPSALKSAHELDAKYTDAMLNGLRLNDIATSTQKADKIILGKFYDMMQKDPEGWDKIAQVIGLRKAQDLAAATEKALHSVTWTASDAFALARYSELVKQGKTGEEAAKIVHRVIASYDPTISVMGEAKFAQLLDEQFLMNFSKYHVSRLQSLARIVRETVGSNSPDRVRASGELFMTTLLALAKGTLFAGAVDSVTGGDKTALGHFLRSAAVDTMGGISNSAARLGQGAIAAYNGDLGKAARSIPLNFSPAVEAGENLVRGQMYPGGPQIRTPGFGKYGAGRMMMNQFPTIPDAVPDFLSGL